jgi:hypothetical protein
LRLVLIRQMHIDLVDRGNCWIVDQSVVFLQAKSKSCATQLRWTHQGIVNVLSPALALPERHIQHHERRSRRVPRRRSTYRWHPGYDPPQGHADADEGIFERCAAQTSGRIMSSWLNGILPFPEWRKSADPKIVCQLGGTLDGGVDLGFKRRDHDTLGGRGRSPRGQPIVQPVSDVHALEYNGEYYS